MSQQSAEKDQTGARKAFKYRLYPTKHQERALLKTLALCRELYNASLEERREAYKRHKKTITYYDQANQLPAIKEIRPEYNDIHSQVLQDTLRRVDKAMMAFFRRVKQGKKPGYPRFKSSRRFASFTYPQAGFSLARDNRVCLSKIGSIKLKLHRPLAGAIKTCTVGTLVFEDLNTAHLTKRPKPKRDGTTGQYVPYGASAKAGLNTSILDAGRYQFQQYCTYKAAEAGRSVLFVSPNNTSQVCSGCGQVRKKELSERWHSCDCGAELDRDHNAAINIQRLGSSQRKPLRVHSVVGTA
jgi:transposase